MVQEVSRIEGDRSFLLVRSGAVYFALQASEVVRVVRGLLCHSVPGSRIHFLGLALYGGEPLPVLDLHAMVEGKVAGKRHRSTVILGRGRRRTHSLLGLAVDEVLRVTDGKEPVQAQEENGLEYEVVAFEGGSAKVLNTDGLLSREKKESEAADG